MARSGAVEPCRALLRHLLVSLTNLGENESNREALRVFVSQLPSTEVVVVLARTHLLSADARWVLDVLADEHPGDMDIERLGCWPHMSAQTAKSVVDELVRAGFVTEPDALGCFMLSEVGQTWLRAVEEADR